MTVASLTFANLRTDVKRRLNEVAADGNWTTTEINTRINRAMLRVAMDCEQETEQETINLRLNVSWYHLPSDCLVPKFLFGPSAWSQLKLFPTTMTALDKEDHYWERATNSMSSQFIPFSYNRFILWPPPRETTTVTLFQTPVPTTLSADGDTTPFRLDAQKLVPIYATYLCLRRYDWLKAKLMLAEYKSMLAAVNSADRNNSAVHTTKMRPATKFDKAHGNPRWGRRF